MEKNKLNKFLFLALAAAGLFFLPGLAAASSADSIAIKTQPHSDLSVDEPFSQQPSLIVEDDSGNPVSGVIVTAFKGSGAGALRGTLTATTQANGVAIFSNLGYNKTDEFKISFIFNGGSPVTSKTLQLSAGSVSQTYSSISITQNKTVADGESLITIKSVCKDKYGNPVPSAKAQIISTGSDNIISQPSASNEAGESLGSLASTKAEQKKVLVSVGGITIGQSDLITFYPGKIAKLSVSADSPVDTDHTSKILVTGVDEFGNTVSNDSASSIKLSVDNGGSLDSSLVTLEKGQASAVLSKTSPGPINVTASYGNASGAFQVLFVSSDNVAPSVLSQYPAAGSKDFDLKGMPYLEFSESIKMETATQANIQLKKNSDNSIVPVEIMLADGGKKITLNPKAGLEEGAGYYIFAAKDLSDPSGNSLEKDYKGEAFYVTKTSLENNAESGGQEGGFAGMARAQATGASRETVSDFGEWFTDNFLWIIVLVAIFCIIAILWLWTRQHRELH